MASIESRSEKPPAPPLPRSYRGRILAELLSRVLFATAVMLFVYGATAYTVSKHTFDRELGERLLTAARLAARQVRPEWVPYLTAPGELFREFRKMLLQTNLDAGTENQFVLDREGHVLVDAARRFDFGEAYWRLELDPEPFQRALKGVPAVSLLYQGREGGVYKIAYAPLKDASGQTVAVLGVEASAEFVDGLDRFAKALFGFGLLCLLLGGGLVYVFGRRLVSPLRQMARASERVAAGDFSPRVPEDAPNELGALGHAFNQMTRRLQAHNEYILESMANGLVVVDLSGTITTFNRAASRILRIPPRRAVGRLFAEAFSRYPAFLEAVEPAFRSGESLPDREVVLSSEDPRVLKVQCAPLLGAGDKRMGTEVLLTDETRVRELEARIKAAEKMATIGELAAGIAHEIRNPLGAMRGFTEILQKRGMWDEKSRELVRDIAEEIEVLNRIVTHFLVFAKPTEPDAQEGELGETVQGLLPLLAREAEERSVRVEALVRHRVEASLDPDQFRRALLNVALNALQASPEGGKVTLMVEGGDSAAATAAFAPFGLSALVSARPGGVWGWVRVADEGPGLPREDAERLFQPFFTTKAQGFGLGLSITRKILEAHRGGVGATDRPGGGAEFLLALPAHSVMEEVTS